MSAMYSSAGVMNGEGVVSIDSNVYLAEHVSESVVVFFLPDL